MRHIERRRGLQQGAAVAVTALAGFPILNFGFFDLAEALIRRGYSDNQIQAVLGGNFRRLLWTIWP